MTVVNLDNNPIEKTTTQFPLVRGPVKNKAIQDAFRRYEEKAAMVATALSAAFSIAFAFFRPSFDEIHTRAQETWKLLPNDLILGDDHFRTALPIVDRRLGIASIRLARFLNDARESIACPAQQ